MAGLARVCKMYGSMKVSDEGLIEDLEQVNPEYIIERIKDEILSS